MVWGGRNVKEGDSDSRDRCSLSIVVHVAALLFIRTLGEYLLLMEP